MVHKHLYSTLFAQPLAHWADICGELQQLLGVQRRSLCSLAPLFAAPKRQTRLRAAAHMAR